MSPASDLWTCNATPSSRVSNTSIDRTLIRTMLIH